MRNGLIVLLRFRRDVPEVFQLFSAAQREV
jgi:hypothetical protein